MILRLDAPIYFANALTVRGRIKALVDECRAIAPGNRNGCCRAGFLDITSADVLKGLIVELKDKGIDYYVAELHLPVQEFGRRTGLLEMIGEDHIFPTLDAAVRFIERRQPDRANPDCKILTTELADQALSICRRKQHE